MKVAIAVSLFLIVSVGYDIFIGEVSLKGAEKYSIENNPIIFWGFAIFRVIIAIGIVIHAKISSSND